MTPKRYFNGERLWIMIFLALFGASCAQPTLDPLVDRSFVTKQPCSPPCWYGLELGQSSKEDIYTTFRELPFIDQSTIREQPSTSEYELVYIFYDCSHPQIPTCGGADVLQDKLVLLWFSVGFELTFHTVVDELGPPDYVVIATYGTDVVDCGIQLHWPESGIMVWSQHYKRFAVCDAISQGSTLDPLEKADVIYYMIEDKFPDEFTGEYTRVPWPGFTEP